MEVEIEQRRVDHSYPAYPRYSDPHVPVLPQAQSFIEEARFIEAGSFDQHYRWVADGVLHQQLAVQVCGTDRLALE
jgi:hypothetical protein